MIRLLLGLQSFPHGYPFKNSICQSPLLYMTKIKSTTFFALVKCNGRRLLFWTGISRCLSCFSARLHHPKFLITFFLKEESRSVRLMQMWKRQGRRGIRWSYHRDRLQREEASDSKKHFMDLCCVFLRLKRACMQGRLRRELIQMLFMSKMS